MKKLITLSILFACKLSLAQTNIYEYNGNVGIGTTNPQYKLDVAGSVHLGGTGAYKTILLGTDDVPVNGYNQSSYLMPATLPGSGMARSVFRFKNNIYSLGGNSLDVIVDGNVGIGTSNPTSTLTITDGATPYPNDGTSLLQLKRNMVNGSANARATIMLSNNSNAFNISYGGTSDRLSFRDGGNIEVLSMLNGGNIGIGTTTPQEKLSVNGKIRAQEIKVENTNWPDYVFQKDYQLPSLAETEKHIQEKGHLPGIPTAKEVEKEGVNLSEVNAKLLQKIEELTLYIIDLEKRMQEVEKSNKPNKK